MLAIWRALGKWLARIVGAGKDRAMFANESLESFIGTLAAGTPTPGGGSAAALAGSLSAALLQMVSDLTLGREKFAAHEAAVRGIRRKAEGLRKDLLALVDRDAQAYDAVVAAMRLPKGTPPELEARKEAIGRASQFATETPLATADSCVALLAMAIELAHKGNPNALSDVGSAALLAYAGLRAGVMNVRANLAGIGDAERAGKLRDHVRRLETDAERLREEALAAVVSRPAGR